MSFLKNVKKAVSKTVTGTKKYLNPVTVTKQMVSPKSWYKGVSPYYNIKNVAKMHNPKRGLNLLRPNLSLIKPTAGGPQNVLYNLFNTNDLKGCAMFGSDTWNELKATVAGFASDVLDGKYYIVPTIISCPARGSGDSLTDELFGFNDDYAAMLGAKWYEKAWSGIKDFTKNTTHMALSAGAVIPITKPFVSAIRSVNDAGKNLLQQFGIIKKSSSDDEAPSGVVTGGGLLILAGVGVGAYLLLKDNKKNKRG